jgi:hypothetical protein
MSCEDHGTRLKCAGEVGDQPALILGVDLGVDAVISPGAVSAPAGFGTEESPDSSPERLIKGKGACPGSQF